jgi:hypothetical protein
MRYENEDTKLAILIVGVFVAVGIVILVNALI